MSDRITQKFILEKKDWILSKVEYFKQFKGIGLGKLGKRDYTKHKADALVLAMERVEHFNNIYDFPYNNVCVKNQKTRWGSCSSKGNLNFNYKILFLDEAVRDYIIVHEICHLKELNHSKKFWALVAQVVPNHKEIRRELKLCI